MDPRLLRYYNQELQYMREMGGEFAKEFPKIAARLGLENYECADPYVERLLEGFSFLAARIQLKMDAEFPRFTQHLLEMVYPHYLAPTPSMAVVQFFPDLTEGSLSDGFVLPRNSKLRSQLGKGEQTACEYRTAHEITLWPIEISEAEYIANSVELPNVTIPHQPKPLAGLRFKLKCTAGLTFNQLALNDLPIYIRGSEELPSRIYSNIFANSVAVVAQSTNRGAVPIGYNLKASIRRLGFEQEHALLPYGPRSFQGYRLLHEYFALPERFLFFELCELDHLLRQCPESQIEIFILFDQVDYALEHAVNKNNFSLFCTPAINLFPKRADRIHLTTSSDQYHVLLDRTRPLDYEVYEISSVVGIGSAKGQEQKFLPFYTSDDLSKQSEEKAYYAIQREPRVLSSKQRLQGTRSSYIGTEVYISIVDALEAPFSGDLKQLSINTLCTNRDLPLHMSLGKGKTDFFLDSGAPVDCIRCISGPTKPRPPHTEGETIWRLISHLSLNYLSLADSDERQGAAALRDLLSLYSNIAEPAIQKQIDGVKSIQAVPVTRRVPIEGPISFGRGLQITLTLNEAAFAGTGIFVFGAVMERFFAKYVSINSFTETIINTTDRGEIIRWPVQIGQRHLF